MLILCGEKKAVQLISRSASTLACLNTQGDRKGGILKSGFVFVGGQGWGGSSIRVAKPFKGDMDGVDL